MRDLEPRIAALKAACENTPGVTSLVVYGSTTTAAAGRRDEWSDLDFTVFVTPGSVAKVQRSWAFLPGREHLVLIAREGDNGGVAVYSDGLLCEFGVGEPWLIRDPDREVLLDGGDIVTAEPPLLPDPADQVGLFLVKTAIGIGRVRRGERVAGNAHIRVYALTALCEALRQRLAPDAPRNPFDSLRRLELALPELATQISELLDGEAETCARGLVRLARTELEPGWAEFPSSAFDVVERSLGWPVGCTRASAPHIGHGDPDRNAGRA